MARIKKSIQSYWDRYPLGSLYTQFERGSKEFYISIEKRRYDVEPHIPEVAGFKDYQGKKVLEIGCGIGTDLRQFAKHSAIAIGIDLSPRSVYLAYKGFKTFQLNGNLLVADAENLPFKDESFDHVYSYGVLHHTPNTEKAVSEIFRTLKSGGSVTAMLYHKLSFPYIYILLRYGLLQLELLKKSEQQLISDHTEEVGYSPLTKMYMKRDVKQLFSKFKVVQCRTLHICAPKLISTLFVPLQGFIGFYIIVKTQKL